MEYTSDNKWFTCDIPTHWSVFKEDDDYLFYDDIDWKGNLRITALKFESIDIDAQKTKVQQFIADELKDNDDAKQVQLGCKNAVYYIRNSVQDGEQLIMHYWITGDLNVLLLCTFTIDATCENKPDIIKEFDCVYKCLVSLEVN